MRTSIYYDKKNRKVEVRSEETPSGTDYWKKVAGVSYSITERHYNSLINLCRQFEKMCAG